MYNVFSHRFCIISKGNMLCLKDSGLNGNEQISIELAFPSSLVVNKTNFDMVDENDALTIISRLQLKEHNGLCHYESFFPAKIISYAAYYLM